MLQRKLPCEPTGSKEYSPRSAYYLLHLKDPTPSPGGEAKQLID